MSFLPRKISCLILPALMLGCGPFPDLRGIVAGDITPPILLGADSQSTRSATIRFNEPVAPVDGSTTLEPTIQPSAVSCTENTVNLSFASDLTPGAAYFIESTVEDKAGYLPEYLDRHPQLADFCQAPTTAMIRVTIDSYVMVNRFQNVVELRMAP